MPLPLLPALHAFSGRVFRYVSARYPESHPLRLRVESGLLRFYRWETGRDPLNHDAHGKVGNLLANRGLSDQAIKSFTRALQSGHPDPGKIHYFMGRERMRQGDRAGATECYRDFVRQTAAANAVSARLANDWSRLEQDPAFDPERFHGYLHLALRCLDSGLNDTALALLHSSIRLEPLVIPAHKMLADLQWDIGCRSESLQAASEGHRFQLQRTNPQLRWSARSSREIDRPDFMILGAMRCGTTSLYDYLVQHPRVCPALTKELHFFTEHYSRGLRWYLAQFPPVGSRGLLTGEASADYIDSTLAADRILRHFPRTRFIVLLRDPVERTISHFQMYRRLGLESGEIEATLLDAVDAADSGSSPGEYVQRSIYVRSLRQWFERFPRDQFLVLPSERLFTSPALAMEQVFGFLGLPPHAAIDFGVRNRGDRTVVGPLVAERLRVFFRPHNRALEALLDTRFEWNDGPAAKPEISGIT